MAIEMVYIYNIENSIFFFSDIIVPSAKLQVMDLNKQMIEEFIIKNSNYQKYTVSIPNGEYLIKFIDIKDTIEKQIHI